MRSARPSQDRKFGCPKCDKKFFTPKDLRRHENTHLGIREHVCLSCHTRFGRKDHLTRHAKKSCSVLRGQHNSTSHNHNHNHHQHLHHQHHTSHHHQLPSLGPHATLTSHNHNHHQHLQHQHHTSHHHQLPSLGPHATPTSLNHHQHSTPVEAQPARPGSPAGSQRQSPTSSSSLYESSSAVASCYQQRVADLHPNNYQHYQATGDFYNVPTPVDAQPARPGSLPGSQRQSPTSSSSLYESSTAVASCYQQRVADLHPNNYQHYQATGDFYNVL